MQSLLQIVILLCLSLRAYSTPLPLGVNFEKRAALPILTLPYASYRAASYNQASDIYTFKNIRYAAPPVGNLRWAKPAPPLVNTTLQDGSYGHACVQSSVKGLNVLGSGNQSPVGAAINQFIGGIPIPLFSGGDEDCLFLDIYVPGKALRNPSSQKLPVVVWIYGGAFVFGSKDTVQPELPFYDGSGLIGAADNGLIFVTMNYRLGAYGFLAGTAMEQEGTPNSGLWDQLAAFQWVRDYIPLLGGDPNRVTAMGESAGAGSILHHLVAEGGKLDPLFSRAILQSPAFQMMWDRAGTVQDVFANFASLAGCGGQGLACLRSASAAAIAKANTALSTLVVPGSFAVGPTPDGSLIRQTPVLELASGNFWPGIESAVLSHTSQESTLFVSGAIQTDAQFDSFLTSVFPNYTVAAGLQSKVTSFYPSPSAKSSPYESQSDRVAAFLRDSCFTCNIRHLTTALGEAKVWNMQYAVSPGWHGTDLVPTFYNPSFTSDSFLENLATLMVPVIGPLVAGISAAMQSYFASYVATGDPNTGRKVWNLPRTVRWDHPDGSQEGMAGVVNVGNWGFSVGGDDQMPRSACDFWKDFAAAATALGGYAPPEAVVEQGLVEVDGLNASWGMWEGMGPDKVEVSSSGVITIIQAGS